MANLEPLARVRKHEVQERQKDLAAFYAAQEKLTTQLEGIRKQRRQEREKAADDVQMLVWLASYETGCDVQIAKINAQLEDLDEKISIARDNVREAFTELKKIEIIIQRRADEKAKEIAKKQSQEIDEIALQLHERKSD